VLTPSGIALAIGALFALGVWACGRTGRDLGVPDHGAMNWDEVVAFLAVLLFTPEGLWWQVGAFVGFRFFDMTKPPPIRRVERAVKGGLGVMVDDLVAAFYTLLLLAIAKRLIG
jgi:phosphatidylglycerophosphatase A